MKSSSCLFAAMLFSVVAISVTKADCGDPPSIPNATNNVTGTSPYPQDTTIRYDCELGYNPVGTSRFYTCTGNTWTDGNFRCEQIYCSHVETPENGRVENTPTYEVGTTIEFACNEGHAMSGQNKMLCRIDGEWLPSTPPTCTARDCGEFGSIQDADLFQDNSYIERNHYGSVVEVTCLDGTTLIGSSQVKCQSNGEWGLRPTCEDVECPPYPKTDSPCISELQTFGVYLFINCKKDVATHFGPNAAECISGQWDTTEMGCLCDCIIPEFNSNILTLNGLNSHGNLPHATMLDWTCHGNRVKFSLMSVRCFDGKFNIQADPDNDIKYSNPSDFTRIILPQLCTLPTIASSSSPSTTASTTLSSSSSCSLAKTSLMSKLTTGISMTQTTAMTMVSVSFSTTVSTSEMSLRTSLSNSTTTYSTMSARVTESSQSVTRSSAVSTSVTVSPKSKTSSSTLSTPETISVQSITSTSTISRLQTESSQSITPSSAMTTQVTVTSQSITPSFSMSTPVTLSTKSITPSSTMSKSVTLTSGTISSLSKTAAPIMTTPETITSQSVTPSSSMSTQVADSSETLTPSSTMSTTITVTQVSTQLATLPSTMSTQVTVTSLSTTPFTMSSSFELSLQSILLPSTMSSLNKITSLSITPSSSISNQDTKMLKEITSSCSMPSSVTVMSKEDTSSSLLLTQVPLISKIISSSSTSLSSTMTSKLTTVPVYSTSSSMPTPLTDATTTTGTDDLQNSTLYNAKDTDSTSRGQIFLTASTDNVSKEDFINSGTIHFDYFLGSSICCIFQMFNILWLKP